MGMLDVTRPCVPVLAAAHVFDAAEDVGEQLNVSPHMRQLRERGGAASFKVRVGHSVLRGG